LGTDPYKDLGIDKNASQDDVQKAYRRLAKKLHPDLNPGNKDAEEEFKKISAAYDLLGDPEKRALFDRGEIDSTGAEKPSRRFYHDFAQSAEAGSYSTDAGFADFAGSDDILSEIFGHGGRSRMKLRGRDVRYHLPVDFLDAINGATRQIGLPDGSEIKVVIPPGTSDRQILRLRGKGQSGLNGGPAGDALIEIEVHPHRMFTRKGNDIYVDLPVSLTEAVLGGKIKAPTPTGEVTLTIPKGANTGTVLRLKGKGVPGSHGDQYVILKVMLPEKPDPELEKFVANWHRGKVHSPRRPVEA
jgi:DnaJ-class molecular chaperone